MIPNLQEVLPGNRKRKDRCESPENTASSGPIILSNLTRDATLGYFYGFSRRWSPRWAKAASMAKIPNPASPSAEAVPPTPTFEQAVAELEAIVDAMETGKMPLQESLDAYQRGMELLKQCRGTLDAAERQIRILESGELRDFDSRDGQAGNGNREG
jgi:exodeoxyribonuclease VII small subunit